MTAIMGPQPKTGRYRVLTKRAIGLLLILERSFVNAIAILIFDPNLISSVPLVRGNLKRVFEVGGLRPNYPSRHLAPFVTSWFEITFTRLGPTPISQS